MDDDPVDIVHCENGHRLHWFRCQNGRRNHGKIYWKSDEKGCKAFYGNNYIQAMAPYDEIEKTVRCEGKK